MEEEIRRLEAEGLKEQADQLRLMKKNQRIEHMNGGAENAEYLLTRLMHPDMPAMPLFIQKEIQRCVDIVRKHDLWKVTPPIPPSTSDRLALTCIEGDMLWPLHPLGVLADLERPGREGMSKDSCNAVNWHSQLCESLKTLIEFRSKWENIPDEDFIDKESIFRTKEGHRLYSEWRNFWNL